MEPEKQAIGRFKFRAWDVERGEMVYTGLERIGDYHECLGHPIMQWTGLTDKNGNEIYSGDIVECIGIARTITVEMLHGVRFMFGLDQINRAIANDGVVIGNVYENPNLLKEPTDEEKTG